MTSKPISNNQTINNRLAEKGYAVIDLLSNEEVNHFLSNWKEIGPANVEGNYCSLLSTDVHFNERVNKIVYELLNPKLSAIFSNIYPILVGSVLIKGTDKDAIVMPHMDPTLVNESLYTTYNMWIPMTDVDETNGCLYTYNDYHFACAHFDKRPCNYDAVNPLDFIDTDFWNNSTPVRMRAGQAIIFDHKLPHASKANFSGKDRIAVSIGIVPREADLYIYYQDKRMHKKNEIERYSVEYTSYYARNEKGIPLHYLRKDVVAQYNSFFFLKKKWAQFWKRKTSSNIQ